MVFRYTYPAFLWAALILVLTLSPVPDIPKVTWINIYHVDKFIHAVLFAVLYFLLMRGLTKQQVSPGFYNRAVAWSIICVILYGAATEILQSLIPTGRSGDILDWLADCAGTGIAYIIYGRRSRQKSMSA
jgi:VanZ family protein